MDPEEAVRWALDYQGGQRETDEAIINEFQAGNRTLDVSVKFSVIRRNMYWYISSGGTYVPPSLGDDLYDYLGDEYLFYEKGIPYITFSKDFWVPSAPKQNDFHVSGTTENKAKLDGSIPVYKPELDGNKVDFLKNISKSITIAADEDKSVTSGGWDVIRKKPESWKKWYEEEGARERDEYTLRNGDIRTKEYGDAWKRKTLYRQIISDYTEMDGIDFGNVLSEIYQISGYFPNGNPYISFAGKDWYTSSKSAQNVCSEQSFSASPEYEFIVGEKKVDWTASSTTKPLFETQSIIADHTYDGLSPARAKALHDAIWANNNSDKLYHLTRYLGLRYWEPPYNLARKNMPEEWAQAYADITSMELLGAVFNQGISGLRGINQSRNLSSNAVQGSRQAESVVINDPTKLLATQAEREAAQIAAQKESEIASTRGWFDEAGNPYWPKNDGFINTPVKIRLEKGTLFSRYGSTRGRYAAPAGTTYEMRSLAPGTENEMVWEVIKPFDGFGGEVAPWFDQPGGGIQYQFKESVQWLKENGYIKEFIER